MNDDLKDLVEQSAVEELARLVRVARLQRDDYEKRCLSLGSTVAACTREQSGIEKRLNHAIESLQKLVRFTEELCEDIKVSKHYHALEYARNFLKEEQRD